VSVTAQFLIQAAVALLAVANPIGAAPIFLSLTAGMSEKERRHAALRATLVVYIILAVSAVAGAFVLRMFGVELAAFRAAGGLVIVIMGLEMLMGSPTRVQTDPSERVDTTASGDGDPILVPFAMPLVAGPGAIATVITLTARGDGVGQIVVVLLAVVVVAAVLLGVLLISSRLSGLEQRFHSIFLRFMGLILVSIGTQLLLSGVVEFVRG
jgi:multiple antibiotic resistance protein